MATVDVQGTKFSFSLLPLKMLSSGRYARACVQIENEYLHYSYTIENILREDMEEWIFCMFRLLAGAYGREYNLTFEKTGMRVDLCPYTENGFEVSRQERRKHDCIMLVSLVLQSAKGSFLGGAQSFMFHREEIEAFAAALREEFYQIFVKYARGKGKHLFVGVSPLGYKGCNYWYLDKTGKTKAGDHVWVCMGRHKLEQVVLVDGVRWFTDETAPYAPERVRQVLRPAVDEEWKR